ncbi:MAG: hypothetical protein L3J12_07105, partial [Spirochaetales bacterium]|nr:hypothetical protein [Spirochaetales bacterium]
MNSSKTNYFLRIVSLMMLVLILSIFFTYHREPDKHDPVFIISKGKEYICEILYENIMEADFEKELYLLFQDFEMRESVAASEPSMVSGKSISIPKLRYVGMINTGSQIIYSFRNEDTGRVDFFEEGKFLNGINLS